MTDSSPEPNVDAVLRAQLQYYRARAGEYDEWFLRQGRYDRGPERNRAWFEQVEQVRERLAALQATLPENARVLELACGTGLWTERLAAYDGRAAHVTAVDASPEVIELNRARLSSASASASAAGRFGQVEYEQADLFAWRPRARYDLVFFGFWLSHVPTERFEAFWRLVSDCLAPRGRVFFVDNFVGKLADQSGGSVARRRLNDGREFEIVKIFYEPAWLEARLGELGFAVDVRATDEYFIYGEGGRA
jgi:demethylmenaquinone methyltransferase/2-methoxy-6-polyprenyl-1,4-benzoquinol methylase